MAKPAANFFDDMAPETAPTPTAADLRKPGTPAPATAPLDTEHRLILQNFFPGDQPARRASYFKQLGYEVNPKDDNQYRPAGSTGGYAEVDPGVHAAFKKDGLAGAFNELSDKAKGAAFTTAVNGTLLGGGSAAGTAVGSMGGPWGALLGGVLGGALGYRAGDAVRQNVGDMLLKENIPPDQHMAATQAMIAAVGAKAVSGAVNVGSDAFDAALDQARTGIGYAARKFGSGISGDALIKAASDPDSFSPAATKGATAKIQSWYKNFFGIAPDDAAATSLDSIKPNSVVGQQLAPLNRMADAETQRLSATPAGNWTVDELTAQMKRGIDALATKFDRGYQGDEALDYLRDKVADVQQKAIAFNQSALKSQPGPQQLGQLQVPYSAGRDVLKAVQEDAFDREVPGSPMLRQIAGGGPDGIRMMMDQKANSAYETLADQGQPPPQMTLPKINAKRSDLFDVYKEATQTLKPAKLESAFKGDVSSAKLDTQNTLQKIGQVVGDPELGSNMQMMSMQREFENLYANNKPTGSSNVITSGLAGAAMGATAGAGVGAAAGMPAAGAVAGGLAGAAGGAMLGNPGNAIATTQLVNAAGDALSGPLAQAAGQVASTPQVGAVAGQAIAPMVDRAAAGVGRAIGVSPSAPPSNHFDDL